VVCATGEASVGGWGVVKEGEILATGGVRERGQNPTGQWASPFKTHLQGIETESGGGGGNGGR